MDLRRLHLLSILLVFAVLSAALGNQTGRIKVVFTPTICKVTCIGSRCHNNCEKGNTTTIISENGHTTDTLTAPNFRVVVCHLPCINGGKCSARDKCQCPPNFVGKFCQMPVYGGSQHHHQQHHHQQHHQQSSAAYSQSQILSTHSLPLTYSHGQNPVFSSGTVNIHIKHPPEASVQIHQVSKLDNYSINGQHGSSYNYHHSESSQKIQQHGHPNQQGQKVLQYHQPATSKNTLGRCFQETTAGQVSYALLSVLASSAIPLINCPPGYKRINSSHCQDMDECQLQSVCSNGECLNTLGSYMCTCKPGYSPDSTLTSCIPNTPTIQEEKGSCFRLVSSARQCLHPVSAQLSKQLCCCSVGKAWGPHCDKCPHPGSAKFKEICPGGMGYTILPNPPVNKPVTVITEPQDWSSFQPLPTPEKPVEAFGTTEEILPGQSLFQFYLFFKHLFLFIILVEVVEKTSPPAPVKILPSNAGQDIAPTQFAGQSHIPDSPFFLQVSCFLSLHHIPTLVSLCFLMLSILFCSFSFLSEVDECQINPDICGQGVCYNTVEGYTCHCDVGYHLDDKKMRLTQEDIDECENKTVCPSGICYNEPGGHSCGSCPDGFVGHEGHCIGRSDPVHKVCPMIVILYNLCTTSDIDECQDERVCIRGQCLNTEGSFLCRCSPGFRLSSTGDECDDVDECQEEASPCQDVGECVNNVGSYTCICPEDIPLWCCFSDIDECGLNETRCGPHGDCENRLGSFYCHCDQGYQVAQDGQTCEDVNECELLSGACGEAECMNMDGSFLCVCPKGQESAPQSITDLLSVDQPPRPLGSSSPLVERKDCYYHLNDENLCESVLSSHVTLQECCCTLGAGWGDNCEVYPCPVNGTGELFNQMCPSGRGFIPNEDLLYGITLPNSYKDVDECKLFDKEVCKGGYCGNTEGSYECYCTSGHYYDPIKLECTDVNECLDESICGGEECLNTEGSYICLCKPPMVLDQISNLCVEDLQLPGEFSVCMDPLNPYKKTTFTECCCRYGEGWGLDCALCPDRNSDDYASMCNIPLGGRRQPYGQDALVAGSVHEYEVDPDYLTTNRYSAFEGLQAEECGILNGCENGRCVRVQEGYTCECFEGYTLDLSRMVCVDVNECLELNTRMLLCKNGKCINTAGSYQCECLPGYRASDKPNFCVKSDTHQTSTHTQ
uniref:Latent-transforming growth factor beta-binding protein 1 n=1 Tax=Cyprinodon variegatus TaxID=28743 RepID=A0A3Q2FWM7_CYPVA